MKNTVRKRVRKGQKYRYMTDSRGVEHRLIEKYEFYTGIIFNFIRILSHHKWLLERAVKRIENFIKKAFANRNKMFLSHVIFYFDKSLSIEENTNKILSVWESLFDYGYKSHSLRSVHRDAIFHSFLSFNVSNSGVYHAHCFFALPPELFRSSYRVVEYFRSKGVIAHAAKNEQTGKDSSAIVDENEAFKWMLYLAKPEGQDKFPKGFSTFRCRSGVLKKTVLDGKPVKKTTKKGSPCVPAVQEVSTDVENDKTQEKPQETQEKIILGEQVSIDVENCETHEKTVSNRQESADNATSSQLRQVSEIVEIIKKSVSNFGFNPFKVPLNSREVQT